ncbi:uncharacterized protein [Dermacentor albipictus]|uniref:uncharacterized protein isoform X4 n=1 Tax=Dermacentor albipictus TaxID=60249 RepID=UPI0038FCF272
MGQAHDKPRWRILKLSSSGNMGKHAFYFTLGQGSCFPRWPCHHPDGARLSASAADARARVSTRKVAVMCNVHCQHSTKLITKAALCRIQWRRRKRPGGLVVALFMKPSFEIILTKLAAKSDEGQIKAWLMEKGTFHLSRDNFRHRIDATKGQYHQTS